MSEVPLYSPIMIHTTVHIPPPSGEVIRSYRGTSLIRTTHPHRIIIGS